MSDRIPHLFTLEREVDETGVSGTGRVAQGVVFPDGTVALRWETDWRSTAIYASIDDVRAIHGHGGHTHVVWREIDEWHWAPDDQAIDPDGRYSVGRPLSELTPLDLNSEADHALGIAAPPRWSRYYEQPYHPAPQKGDDATTCRRCGLLWATITATGRPCVVG